MSQVSRRADAYRRMHAAVAVGVAFAGTALAGAASATSLPDLVVGRELSIELQGHITTVCALGSVGNVAFGELGQGGQVFGTDVGLTCNTPFDFTVKAANGGLSHETLPNGQGPYAGRLGYAFKVDIPVRDPAQRVVSGAFRSRDLVAGRSLSSGEGVAFDGARLRIELDPVVGAGLLGGRYSEVITVSIAPRT